MLDKIKMINSIGDKQITLLFELKKSDLLAQSPKFHYLLNNIFELEKDIKTIIEDRKVHIKDIIDSTIYFEKLEYNNLVILVNDVIDNKIRNENTLSHLYDMVISLVFLYDNDVKKLFYKLYNYTKIFNKELSDDYERIFLAYLNEDNEFNDNLLKKLKKE